MNIATIYCKPHIAHWLYRTYGNPVRIPRGCNFRTTLLSCMTKEFHPHSDFNKSEYSERVDIRLHKDLISEIGHTLSLSQQHMINSVIDEQIDAEIFLFIMAHVVQDITVNTSIATYQQLSGFTESVFAFDTIRQRYFRYKKNLKNIFLTSVTAAA